MAKKYMLLPSQDFNNLKLLEIPGDMEQHEAYRHATGLIASFQESEGGDSYDGLDEWLEDKGFTCVDFMLGPELDLL